MNFLETTFGYRPKHIFAVNDEGCLLGMLPLYEVKTIFGNKISCSPFAHYCPCLGEGFVSELLIETALNKYLDGEFQEIEFRSEIANPKLVQATNYCTHMLSLNHDYATLWKKMDKSSVRWAINKSQKMGVSTYIATTKDELRQFYELNCLTKRDIGVPAHPLSFFKNLFNNFKENAKLFLSTYDEEIIGGGVMLYHNNKILYGYGAADPNNIDKHPYHSFIWEAIKNGHDSSYDSFDFGRTEYSNEGLINFKKRWGTTEIPIIYSTHIKSAKQSKNKDLLIKTGGYVMRKSPLLVYKKISDVVFNHLG